MNRFGFNIDCCGCSACFDICPKKAITMNEDEFGFVFPKINEELCINCKACIKTCPFLGKKPENTLKETFIVANKDDEKKLKSSSGGVFPAMCKSILGRGGVVFGVEGTCNDTFNVRHIFIDDYQKIDLILNSKYVQSDTRGIYNLVRQKLNEGKRVLFSGTPCQVYALKKFLIKDYDNLFTVETICHGVPSSKIFNDYLKFIERKYHIKIVDFIFRSKKKGWGKNIYFKGINSKGKVSYRIIPSYKSSYFTFFLKGDFLRESCGNCIFASENRAGDVTLGDCWGVETIHPEYLDSMGGPIDRKKGVSCMVVNNNKGVQLFDFIRDDVIALPSDYSKIALYNKQLVKKFQLSKNRDIILNKYKKEGYSSVDSYFKTTYMRKDRNKVLRVEFIKFLRTNRFFSKLLNTLKKEKKA